MIALRQVWQRMEDDYLRPSQEESWFLSAVLPPAPMRAHHEDVSGQVVTMLLILLTRCGGWLCWVSFAVGETHGYITSHAVLNSREHER